MTLPVVVVLFVREARGALIVVGSTTTLVAVVAAVALGIRVVLVVGVSALAGAGPRSHGTCAIVAHHELVLVWVRERVQRLRSEILRFDLSCN